MKRVIEEQKQDDDGRPQETVTGFLEFFLLKKQSRQDFTEYRREHTKLD